jgi:hypothetical protein
VVPAVAHHIAGDFGAGVGSSGSSSVCSSIGGRGLSGAPFEEVDGGITDFAGVVWTGAGGCLTGAGGVAGGAGSATRMNAEAGAWTGEPGFAQTGRSGRQTSATAAANAAIIDARRARLGTREPIIATPFL